MMNENNDVFTMEDEPIASVVQDMRKGSKWLSAFLESCRAAREVGIKTFLNKKTDDFFTR